MNVRQNTVESSLLWKITKPGSDKASYLFGTMHDLNKKKRDLILNPIFNSSIFRNADLIITEMGDREAFLKEPELEYKLQKDREKMADNLEKTMDFYIANVAKDKKIPVFKIENMNRLLEAQQKISMENFIEKQEKLLKPKNIIKGVAMAFTFPLSIPIYCMHRVIQNAIEVHQFEKNYMKGIVEEIPLTKTQRTYFVDNRNLLWYQRGAEINTNHPLSAVNSNVKKLLNIDDKNVEEDTFSLRMLLLHHNLFIAVGYGHLKSNGYGLIELLQKEGYTVAPVDLAKLNEDMLDEKHHVKTMRAS